jgi:DnaJ-domain-containing protein 1
VSQLKRASRILKAKLQRVSRAAERWAKLDSEPLDDCEDPWEPEATPEVSEHARALETLELSTGASPDEIRGAYRSLCRRYHPDYFASDDAKSAAANELLAEINRAYELLTSS